MKFKSTLLLSIITLSSFMVKADNSDSCLLIKGYISEKGKKSYQAKVKAFEGNNLIWFATTAQNGSFEFIIPQNKYVTLVVEKDGFMSKYIMFDTRSERMPRNLEPYECQIDLVQESDLKGVDISRLEFPIAIVEFDKKTKQFNHNTSYTDNMIEDYNYLLNKAALKQKAQRKKRVKHSKQ